MQRPLILINATTLPRIPYRFSRSQVTRCCGSNVFPLLFSKNRNAQQPYLSRIVTKRRASSYEPRIRREPRKAEPGENRSRNQRARRSWLARTRTPPKTPFTFVDRNLCALARKRGENFDVTVSRAPKSSLPADVSDDGIYRLVGGLHHLLSYLLHHLDSDGGLLSLSPSFLHLLALSTRARGRRHHCRRRSEKEVNARESVPLGKELGQEPMVRCARWSDRF